MKTKTTIAIYGAGSMGTVLGAFLFRAGYSVDLISRDREHIEALKTNGAKIAGEISLSTPPFDGGNGRGRALLPPEVFEAGKTYDIVILLTKQGENGATAETLGRLLGANGILCTMQNGVPEPALREALGRDRVLGCICIWGATKTAPGEARLTSKVDGMRFGLEGAGDISPAMLNDVKPILDEVCQTTIEENFIGARWSKLLINAAFSGTSAVTGFSFGEIARNRRARDLALNIVKECIDVCRAAGIKIEPVNGKFSVGFLYPKNPVKKLLLSLVVPIAMRKHRAIRSGMLKDLDRGTPCEIEAINGEVCRAGRKHGVPTPHNDWIVETVRSIERGERGYGPRNLEPLSGTPNPRFPEVP